jgi:hypothetical protein
MTSKKPRLALPPLATLATPMVHAKKKPRVIDAATAGFLPWLDRHGPKELKAWNLLASKHHLAVRSTTVSVARAYGFSHAVNKEDGCWVARVRAIFCALSPIIEEDEELHFASWWAFGGGTAVTWYTHQDELEIQGPMPSIASYLVQRYASWEDAEALQFPTEWSKAAKAATRGWSERVAHRAAPPHLSVPQLQPRTDWIVQLFLDLTWGDGDPLDHAPAFTEWSKEQRLARAWPHLQAYWLLHHLVWDNREALPALLAMAERRYPAVKELAGWATSVLANKPITVGVWDEERIRGFRVRAAERAKSPMSPAALARLAKATTGSRTQSGIAASERAKLAADKKSSKGLAVLEIAKGLAGKIPALEEALNEHFNGDDADTKMMVFLWNRRGNATLLRHFLTDLEETVTPTFAPFFEAFVRKGADFAETHEKNVFGALAGLGLAVNDWARFVDLVRTIYGVAPEALTRLRRLEIAAVAQAAFQRGDRRGLDFLRREAERFADDINEWETDTAITSLAFLVRQGDPKGVAIFNGMMRAAKPSGANWTTLVVFCKVVLEEVRSKALLPGVRAMVASGLGRHDDGDRALVYRAFMACGGRAADLAAMMKNDRDARTPYMAAAVAAALVEAGDGTAERHARAAFDELLAEGASFDAREVGAAISLLQAIAAKKLPGFRSAADLVYARTKRKQDAKKSLVRWLATNRTEFT